VWARESIGRSVGQVASRLHVSENLVTRWESGEKSPTLNQVRTLAGYYKRPLAAFFLPEPPEEPPLPKDYRTLPGEDILPLSPKTRLALRRARRLQCLTKELNGDFPGLIAYRIGGANLSDDPESLAAEVRNRFGVTSQVQFAWEKDSDALDQWRRHVEDQGVLVFQMSWPLEEARAFSISEGDIPVIVLNTKDHIRARVFSLFHEFAHLLLEEGGICDPIRGLLWATSDTTTHAEDIRSVEIFCNHFAGALLVARDDLLGHDLVRRASRDRGWPNRTLGTLAREFKVSREVILRRLLISGRASRQFYQMKHEEWETKAKELQERKGGGRRDPPKECVQQNGAPFVSLVLESYRNDRITCSDVSDYLNIRLKHLPKVEGLVEVKG
ncbi:MAG: ImmA/IrrE family metallo-endopeptidase, partial [Thermoplasmata archaeon]|nr:ImmA/IrrE family metallo-endopeptidase [Thermoplasmata archaeon]